MTFDTSTASGVVEWLSNDPIGISGGLNQYLFCSDNPVSFIDPLGLCEDEKNNGRPAMPPALLATTMSLPIATELGAAGSGSLGAAIASNPVGWGIGFGLGGAVVGTALDRLFGWSDKIADAISSALVPEIIFNSEKNPWIGKPGEVKHATRPDGKPKQTRRYGNDGYPETDTDWDHAHGQGKPHVHDWKRPPDGGPPTDSDRGTGRPPRPGDPGIL